MEIRIPATEITKREEYVREPVDKIVNELLQTSDKKIILPAGRGTGRSTVLSALENRGIGTEEQTIYYYLDPASNIGRNPTTKYDKELYAHFYELKLTSYILAYISKNYPILFAKHFEDDQKNVNKQIFSIIHRFNVAINDSQNIPIEEIQKAKNILAGVIEKFQTKSEVKKLNLAFDRFDRSSSSSEYVQKQYEKQFRLFDKVFLTSDDPYIDTQALATKGYTTREIDYGKDKNTLREIIRRRIIAHNRSEASPERKKNLMDEEFFTGEEFMDRIIILGSNIRRSLEVINSFKDYGDLYPDYSIGEKIQKFSEEQKERDRILEKRIERHTLYL